MSSDQNKHSKSEHNSDLVYSSKLRSFRMKKTKYQSSRVIQNNRKQRSAIEEKKEVNISSLYHGNRFEIFGNCRNEKHAIKNRGERCNGKVVTKNVSIQKVKATFRQMQRRIM
ncbi:hypothetical protein CEXT_251891 [Caerostris extrusa]|uniref:Uncharacterized protein n=1 Tax=Caerostris extrusa TaxID=172846 RepID=A0AAV4WCG9_CAEEX|nr:hypothetical protein CEXT_251891 [Caerostris extrusa]